jgi:alkylated DNA repair dioxygenase AlkB
MEYKSEIIEMPDADVIFYPEIYDEDERKDLFAKLKKEIAWEEKEAKFPWGAVKLPRLVAWYGDANKEYRYSGMTMTPNAWTDTLLKMKEKVEKIAGAEFNSVLLNLYRDENDSVGWHSDDEPELGANPVIASVSFGATRLFQLKHKALPKNQRDIDLVSGSLLVMRGGTQRHWQHRVPKVKTELPERINLTFRFIY